MKKLLYFMGILLLFTQCREYDNIVTYQIDGKNTNKEFPVKISFVEDEYVVNFPENPADAEQMREHLVKVKGLHYVTSCPCSPLLQQWGGKVKIIPDGSTPPPPPEPGGDGTSFTKNYLLMDVEPDNLKSSDRQIPEPDKQLEQPSSTTSAVTIAIVDSGMDFSLEKPPPPPSFLFRNTENAPICNSNFLKEGYYGMNVMNWLANSDSLEPKDTDGHGTFINGIISAKAEMPMFGYAVNPYLGSSKDVTLKLLHVRFVRNRKQDATLFDALCGVHYALSKGAKVINASWRSLANGANRDSLKKSFIRTMKAIVAADAVLVAGAGNDHLQKPENEADIRVFPASFSLDPRFQKNVIAVGAWDLIGDKVPNFSNEGKFVDVYAPGVDIQSTDLNNAIRRGWSRGSGTSYATPYVSRLAAILLGSGVPIDSLKGRITNNLEGTATSPDTKLINHKRAVNNDAAF